MRKFARWLGIIVGFFLYGVFFFWKDLVNHFVFMVRSVNYDRWQQDDAQRVAYEKAHLDDMIGGSHGDN